MILIEDIRICVIFCPGFVDPFAKVIAETVHLKSEVGHSPFPSRYIYIYIYIYISINMTYRGVEICFASIMQASAKPCGVFSCLLTVFSCFSCLHQPNLRSPNYVMIMPVNDCSCFVLNL